MRLARESTLAASRAWLAGCLLVTIAVSACGSLVTSPGPSAGTGPSANSSSSPTAIAEPSQAPSHGGSTPSPTAAVDQASSPGDATPSPVAAPCQSDVDMGVLPTWARAGFSDPELAMPHLLTRSGDVAAILFGFPLASPPREGLANKILWVQRAGLPAPVEIRAQRMEGTTLVGVPVERRLEDGFGPSIVDLPDPGCWRLTLTYGDRTDSIDLEYIQTPAG